MVTGQFSSEFFDTASGIAVASDLTGALADVGAPACAAAFPAQAVSRDESVKIERRIWDLYIDVSFWIYIQYTSGREAVPNGNRFALKYQGFTVDLVEIFSSNF